MSLIECQSDTTLRDETASYWDVDSQKRRHGIKPLYAEPIQRTVEIYLKSLYFLDAEIS